MRLRQTPYAQIAHVLWRSVNPQDTRWVHHALIFLALLAAAGWGIASHRGAEALLKSVIAFSVFTLQVACMFALTALMRLNHPVASRTVPGYVAALRRTALCIWVSVCLTSGVIGLLADISIGQFLFLVNAAGAATLFISTPMRWPVRWCLCFVGLVWLTRHNEEILSWEPVRVLLMNWPAQAAFAAAVFASIAWLVTRVIAERGNAYASLFARFLAMQPSAQVVDKPTALGFNKFSLWFKAYVRAANWLTLPWQRYAKYVLASPSQAASNVLARAELGFGPVVHWVTQASASAAFAVLLLLVWWIYPGWILENSVSTSVLTVVYVGLVSVACAATAVLYIGDVLLRTRGEQKLMLLLPGMPQGNALSRMLCARHLRQAFMAWSLATAWALVLPYPDSAAIYVAAFCWGTLPLVPFVVQDWATARPPKAERVLLSLVLVLMLPVAAWMAMQYLHMPVWLLAASAMGACLLVLRRRWSQVKHYPQALPAGHQAQSMELA